MILCPSATDLAVPQQNQAVSIRDVSGLTTWDITQHPGINGVWGMLSQQVTQIIVHLIRQVVFTGFSTCEERYLFWQLKLLLFFCREAVSGENLT
jgi:hypothetical protein